MAFGKKGGDAPRVVGFDFGPAVAAPPAVPEAPVAEAQGYPPPAYPPPAYPPPVVEPPAYEPPRAAPEALAGYLAPVSTMAPPTPVPGPGEEPEHRFWRAGAEIPTGWSDQVALPRKRRAHVPVRGIVSLVVACAVALGGYRTYQRFFGDPFTRPAVIGEYELLTSDVAEKLAADMRNDMLGEIGRPVAGMYGFGGRPEFLLIAGDASDRNARGMYDDLARDVADDRGSIGAATPVADVVCATVVDDGESAVVCFWASKSGADGMVFHFGSLGVAETGRFTSLAKAAIV